MSDDPVAFAEGIDHERSRIRSAFKQRCGMTFPKGERYGREGLRCGLNKGHIGGCSQRAETITISRARLEEILNG